MSRPVKGALRALVLLVLAAFLLGPTAAGAVCPDESGIGGTGLTGDDDSGVGGTGLTGDDEESGIGGTGHSGEDDDSGLGGTGLLGTITARGSVCVNGFTVEYDDRTPVEENGVAADAGDLGVGSLVVVDAGVEQGALRARRIAIRHAAVGPVTKLDAATRHIEVVGQPIEVADGALLVDRAAGDRPVDLASFGPGSYVAVSGLREADGRIVATRLERRPAREDVSVTGRLARGPDGQMAVGETAIELRAPRQDTEPTEGEAVLVSGHWNAISGSIEGANAERAYPIDRRSSRVSVEGYVQEIDAEGHARVEGLAVRIDDRTRGERDLKRGDRVLVGGRFDREGRLRASDVRRDREWRDRVDRRDRQRASDHREANRHEGDDRERGERDREDRDRDREDREDREDGERGGGRDDRDDREDREDREKPENDD